MPADMSQQRAGSGHTSVCEAQQGMHSISSCRLMRWHDPLHRADWSWYLVSELLLIGCAGL